MSDQVEVFFNGDLLSNNRTQNQSKTVKANQKISCKPAVFLKKFSLPVSCTGENNLCIISWCSYIIKSIVVFRLCM